MKHVWKGLLLSSVAASLALAQGYTPGVSTPGEKWKVTTSMQMSGMSMPAQTMEICKPTNADAVPVKTDDNCQIYDVKRSGNTQSFKMRCTGEEPAEGSAEFTYLGSDRYQGKMLVNTSGQTMTMAYEGQKLGGTCDAGALKRETERMIAESERQQAEYERMEAESCRKLAADASAPSMMGTKCKDPEDIKAFCSVARTHDRFEGFAEAEQSAGPNANFPGARPLTEAATLCGFSIEGERARLCESAEVNGKFDFIASQCPVQAQALARVHCAGRSYTNISERYRALCAAMAHAQQEEQRRQEEQSPAGKAKGLLNAGKKALGLFNN